MDTELEAGSGKRPMEERISSVSLVSLASCLICLCLPLTGPFFCVQSSDIGLTMLASMDVSGSVGGPSTMFIK